jgi:GNAT superfamily N-acetyltransferase
MFDILPSANNILSELLTGIMTASFVGLVALAIKIFKRRSVERKFPVSGKYISFFEDYLEGNKVVVPSSSRVTQRGDNVQIVTTDLEGRSWTLEGKIMPGGHISGVYSADATYDDGVGSFYLKISKDSLDGMWNGYDSVNRTTSSGRYWFNKVADIKFTSDIDKYKNKILHVSSNAFGAGYLDASIIKNDNENFAIIAKCGEDFVGYCLGYIAKINSVQALIKDKDVVVPDDVKMADEHGSLGVISTIVVTEKFRKRGAGKALISEAEGKLREKGAQAIVVPAWKKGEKAFLDNILRNSRYVSWFTHNHFWKKSCEAREFNCVAYDGKCQCQVEFFRKSLF